MANPLAALGNILQGRQPDATSSKDIFDAVQKDEAADVETFLSRGVRINELNGDGWSAVQMACWHDSMKALGALLKWNPDLGLQDSAGRTAVHLAAFNGSERCLRRVLHAGAQPDVRDKYGLTPLHKAAVAGQLASIRTLLEYKADSSLATADGLTAAHLAAWKGQREVLRLLASGRADMQAASADGGTPLHEAVRSGDQGCVELLLQLGANPAVADRVSRTGAVQFGRTPADLAFAAGNRAMFAVLHEATQKAAAAAVAPEDTPDIPDPSEFWQYIKEQGEARPTAAAPTAQGPLNPQGKAQPKPPHPREQFEAWLGGILFPQRQRASTPSAVGGSPYGTVNASAKPPPSLAQPAFKQMMRQGQPAHSVGHVGGSQFAARKAAHGHTSTPAPSAAPAQAPADAPVENIQLTLDPYEDEAPPQAAAAVGVGAGYDAVGAPPENPLAAMMQAIGKRAQKDIKTTMDGVASMMSSLPPENPQAKAAAAGGAKTATAGDEEAYDSDEYDEAVLEKKEVGDHADGEDWGEFEEEDDDWGTTGAAALKAKKYARRAAAAEGRIFTMQEARDKLDQLDAVTAAAQGWLRARGTHQRLAALNTFASAYPKVPQPAAGKEDSQRVKAANPLAILTQGLWQARPHEQEDERMAVQAHLQTATAAASVAAQASGDSPSPVPLIDFRDAWKATDGFSKSSLLLEDVFGKVFRADVLGGTHALRVLDSSLYNPAGLSQYLEAAAQFDHAHIVRVKGAAPDRGMLVLDLPESGNLLYVLQTAVLPTTERLGWNSCVDIALAVASALQHLHNRPIPMAHGRLNAAAVYFDRHAVAKVGDVGLAALCGAEDIASGMLMARDLHSLGEIMMQLLTLNTQPIDDGMRKSIVDFADAGKHIVPSTALSWPKTTAETFEAVAIACMRAGDGEDTAKALNDGVVPALQSMRGETLQTMWKQSGAGAKQRADGSYIVPTAYRCPLTGDVMLDPVRAADGFVYERSAIEQWLSLGRKRSPMANTPLSHPYVTPDRDLRAAIEGWLQSQTSASAPVAT